MSSSLFFFAIAAVPLLLLVILTSPPSSWALSEAADRDECHELFDAILSNDVEKVKTMMSTNARGVVPSNAGGIVPANAGGENFVRHSKCKHKYQVSQK